jgi:NADPH2:quinone reductase
MYAQRIKSPGGPEAMEWLEVPTPVAGPGDVVVRTEVAGVNYIDTYHRSGLYPMALPFTPGMEGAGVVVAAGEATHLHQVGDRIAWPAVMGSYAEFVVVPEERAVAVPSGVGFDVATTLMVQGMTAHYLALETFPLQPGDRCLIHAGAGGVGLLLIQIAKHLGAEVFTTVGSPDKAELARAAGADHTILYREVDFADRIEGVIGAHSIDVVYDGVGQAVFDRSLDVLRPRGMMATFGNASGAVEPLAPLRLMQGGSLVLTRPNLTHFIAERSELARRASDLFAWSAEGWLQVRVGARLPLTAAVDAHRLIESRTSTGKILLLAGDK